MKKGTKITLIVLAVLLAISAIVFLGADVAVSHLVKQQVNKSLAALPEGEASCGAIHVRLFSGTADVNDIRFAYHGVPISPRDTTGPGASIYIEKIAIGRIFYSLLFKKEVRIHDIRIIHPQVELWMDEEHPELCFPTFPKDTTMEKATFPLKSVGLMHFYLKDASFALHSVRTKLDVDVEQCSLAVNDLAYDSTFHYCDSVYAFSLAHAKVLFPDGRMCMETHDISHKNQGALTLGATRIANTMSKKRLGDIVKEPVTWMDMRLERVELSPLNPIRKALAQDLTLDHIEAVVERMEVFRDERFKPKNPFPMPQQLMMEMPFVFLVRHADAQINAIHIEFASTEKNIGQLDLANLSAGIDNITNRKGATMRASGSGPMGEGKADASFKMTMNKACEFGLQLQVTNANADLLNPFVRPLVGMTAECVIDTLNADYTGNINQAEGTFRMLYHGLQIQVHKGDDIPYKIITKNANTFTTLGNTLIPKSNPTAVDILPRAYQVTWKHDEWKPFPLYLFGPCIDGVKKTFLPGLYVHLQVNSKKQ